jgi:hypothetical protein
MIHLVIELVGRRVVCSRDGATLHAELSSSGPARLVDGASLSIVGFWSRARLIKVTYRTLAPPDNKAVPWQNTPFADQQALNRFLAERVILGLGSPSYKLRQQAGDLLLTLWPLSRPAIEARLKASGLQAEVECRLAALVDDPPDQPVVSPPTDDPADKPPANVKDMAPLPAAPAAPAASQPDKAPAIKAPIRKLPPVQIQPMPQPVPLPVE